MPFSLQKAGLSSVRYQQVYSATDFLFGAPNGGYIDRILFRLDSDRDIGNGCGSCILPDIQIDLSTTTKSPDSLSPVFADNVGSDDTVIHARGSLTWIAGRVGGGRFGPQEFVQGEMEIKPATPFFYDPRAGNLLLDVRNYIPDFNPIVPIGGADANDAVGDSISSVWASGVDSLSGNISTKGLDTVIFIEPVPEPSTGNLIFAGILAAAFWKWRHSINIVPSASLRDVRLERSEVSR